MIRGTLKKKEGVRMIEIVMTLLLLVSAYFAWTSGTTWLAILFIVLALSYVLSFAKSWSDAKKEMESNIRGKK